MDKPRTLPPLVRGRVTRVLEFFVDKIKFFRNILLLTDNFDLVLQVQWWGESLPALIRPKELQIEDRILKNSHSLDSSHQSEKYEIKTTLELFQSYLKTCEVLELSVLEAVENFVIGSAFLRNLINLLKNNNELISMPIFDYLGEEIGELVIHVNFLEKPQKKIEMKQNENAQLFKYDYSDKKFVKDCDMLSNLDSSYLSLGEKTLFYNGRFSQGSYQENFSEDSQPQIELCDLTKNVRTKNFDSRNVTANDKHVTNQVEPKSSVVRKKSSSESLPNIKILSDSSKVLCFGVSSQFKPKSVAKNTKIKAPSKFSSDSIKCKSKLKVTSDKSGEEKKKVAKTVINSINFPKKQIDLKKEKQFNSKILSSEKLKNSAFLPGYERTDNQNISSKEASNAKVLDYLLGCDMTKDSEEKALNDFKKMSPSHNLVDSINQLCLVSDNNSLRSASQFNEKSVSPKPSYLNFDFSNPIERDYYEKFFSKSNPSADFEVAELLNQPENSFKLGRSHYKIEPSKKSQVDNLKCFNKFSLAEEKTKNFPYKEFRDSNININDRAKSCGRCKYYKKLDELDTIIESLKHFEQKMIIHEKNLQSTDLLIRRNHFAEGS